VIKGLLWLIGGTALFAALVTYPARLLAERQEWERPELTALWSATAALLCLVPTALTFAWTRRAHAAQPEQQLLAVMGGTGVRMAFVLAVGLVLFLGVKEYEYQRFWMFVVVYYLFTLALEMILIVRGTAAQPAQPKN
jgi:hypothetical protein